jgi:hypothetical protein
MPVTKSQGKKEPTQNPVSFFKCEQQGGAHGKPTNIPQELKGGPMREKIMGRKELGRQEKN